MGEGARVDYDAVGCVGLGLEEVDDGAFVVGLEEGDLYAELGGPVETAASTSARVWVPYWVGSRLPRRFRLGPLTTRTLIGTPRRLGPGGGPFRRSCGFRQWSCGCISGWCRDFRGRVTPGRPGGRRLRQGGGWRRSGEGCGGGRGRGGPAQGSICGQGSGCCGRKGDRRGR